MRFESWGFLFLLLLLPIFHRLWLSRNLPAKIRLPFGLRAAPSSGNPVRTLLWLRYLGLVLLIIALARPQSSFTQVERSANGIDIMLVMDVSLSMNIEDLSDRSRFDIAKEVMENFIKGRTTDRIGFVSFSGEAVTHAPPTLDYGLVMRSIRDVEMGVLKDGTAIGDGLAVAINRLRNSTAKSRVIVLLTDGDNNVGQVDPQTSGELAQGFGIKVYTIAIGREGRVRLPIRRKDAFGRMMPTQYTWFDNALNPKLLEEIAGATGGKFYRVTDEKALEGVFSEIDRLERTEVKTSQKTRYNDRFQTPLQFGVLLLLIAQLLAQGWWRLTA